MIERGLDARPFPTNLTDRRPGLPLRDANATCSSVNLIPRMTLPLIVLDGPDGGPKGHDFPMMRELNFEGRGQAQVGPGDR